MYTISSILMDINRGCVMHNLNEDCFSYRIIYYTNEGNASRKYYVDSTYGDLRKTLEGIIRNNLSLTNTVVISKTTVLLNGHCVCLQSRSYGFSLDTYFQWLNGERGYINRNYGRKKARWY